MSHTTGTQRAAWHKRALSLLLAAVMLIGLVPGLALPAKAEHWADSYLDQLVDWGVIRADQTANPDAPLTRAEFMAVINRAYGYSEKGPIPFEDVLETDWFYDDVSIAYTAGYMAGTSEITASPNATLTREEAVCILGRNMMMKDTPGESLAFADSRDVSTWAQGTIKTAVDHDIISGYPDNTFHPQAAVSKGQMAVLITQCLGMPIQASGDYELGGVYGNVTITSPNVTLRNTTISGDLYISGGVGLGGIRLENVNVLGRIIVSGTGESEAGAASVVMRNVAAEEMLVDNMRKKTVTIRADGITDIAKTVVRTSAYLEDNNTDDKGLMHVELDGDSGAHLTLAGRIKEVVNKTPNSMVQVAKGTVAKLTVDEAAVNSTVQLDRNTQVKEMNLDVATNVTGDGDIGKLNVNAPGSVVSTLPDHIYIRPGITGNINGVVMDHVAAEEGSLDPRLLAGYPAAKDITPTGLRADFAGNKKGTIYWAVSSITDGSIGADDLIAPPSYGSKAVRNGSLAAPSGGGEVSAQITGLTVGGAYYLSAVLVDDQGNRSPVKVISFTTPDNSVPAFGQGYPYMSFVGKESEFSAGITAQVAVLATKSCKMYYTVLDAGAAAPTVDELKAAAVSGNFGYGVVDLKKNEAWTGDEAIIVSRRLQEQKNYVLYLWLTDGVNSSDVTSLAFTTPDVTPPEFVMHPQANGEVQATSVPMAATLSENGTIFWVVVESGADYPKPHPSNDKENAEDGKTALLTSSYAKLQVSNGMNAVRSGRVTATGNTQVNLNITGLEAEKSYDLYYMARDTAGNDTIQVYKLQGGIRTKDENAPTVRQFFTSVDPQDPTRPRRNTSIVLEFSENVRLGGSQKDLLSLYQATQEGTTTEKETALAEFVEALRKNINMKIKENAQGISAVRGNEGVSEDKWAVDFAKAQVKNVGGKVQLTFPNKVGEEYGLRLESGGTYFFEVNIDPANKITDLSGYEMEPTPVVLDEFPIVFAQIGMTSTDFRLMDEHRPEAIDKENENNQGMNIGVYKVDMKFRLRPEDTELVADGIAYDLILWTNTDITYDLYYRAVTGDAGKERVLTAERDDTGKFIYGMPNMPVTPDKNGWVKLGNSGSYVFGNQAQGRPGKRLHYTFNNCQSGTGDGLPNLNTLRSKTGPEDGQQQVFYDFVIVVRSVKGQTNPDAWGDEVKFYVDVAAGYPSNLANLKENVFIGTWDKFREDKLNGGGGESLGLPDRYETDPRQLYMNWSPEDSLQPEFSSTMPEFVSDPLDETKMSMWLGLADNRAGTIYYVVGYANRNINVPETLDTSMWEPSVTTKLEDGSTITPDLVPGGGRDRELQDPDLPTLDENAPLATNIQSPNGSWIQENMVVANGSIDYEPGAPREVKLENLMPDRTYYVYFVITGSSDVPSAVEIYKFKTDPVSRPELRIGKDDAANPGRASIVSINMDATLSYKILSKQRAENEPFWGAVTLGSPLTAAMDLESRSLLPKAYQDWTIYDALWRTYDYKTASSEGKEGYFPTVGTGSPENYSKEYSVFDIYASVAAKTALKEWIEKLNTNPVDEADKQNRTANAVLWGQYKLYHNEEYYVVAMGVKYPEDVTDQQKDISQRYSFKGEELKLGLEGTPVLDSANGSFTVAENATTNVKEVTGGTIILTFDRRLYKTDKTEITTDNLASVFLMSDGIDFNDPDTGVSVGTNGTTTVTLKLKGPTVNAMIGGSQLANSGGTGAPESLFIQHSRTKWPDSANSDENQGTYIINVFWGTGNVTANEANAMPVYGTGPGIPAPITRTSVPKAQAASSRFNVNSANTVDGVSQITFDAPLYLGEETPVTSVKQLLDIADEVKGIDVSRSQVVSSEDGTTLILRLNGKAEDVSLKIKGGKLTNSTGEAASEPLSVQIDKRVETNQANMKVNSFYTDVSWGDKTWTDKGTNK